MKKASIVISACGVAALLLVFGIAFFLAQRADYGWDPAIATPEFTAEHPRVLIDEGHYNASSAGIAGRYWPFARLLRADGYSVERGKDAFTRGSCDGVQVFSTDNGRLGDHPIQVNRRVPYGMNDADNDNRHFVLNVMHWLSHEL